MKIKQITNNKQIIGNQGLYFVSFKLSRYGFNTIITSRNSKGADILITNDDCTIVKTIQVKSTTKRQNINIGKFDENHLQPKFICNYWIFVDLSIDIPKCYIFTKNDLEQNSIVKIYNDYFWLQSVTIYDENNLNKWEKITI